MSTPLKNFAPKNAAAPPGEKNAAPSFTVSEIALAARLGLTRERLRDLREEHLAEHTDWRRAGRGTVMLTAAAEARLVAAAGLQPADLPRATLGLLTFPGYPAQDVVLKVWRTFPNTNPTVMECYHRGTDPNQRRNIVRVRVKNTANFVQHMEVPARLIPGHTDYYQCTRPAPRQKGRW